MFIDTVAITDENVVTYKLQDWLSHNLTVTEEKYFLDYI